MARAKVSGRIFCWLISGVILTNFTPLVLIALRHHIDAMASKGVSIGQACRMLGVSADELRAMMADGRLRYRRINSRPGKPGHVVIHSGDVEAVLKPSSAA